MSGAPRDPVLRPARPDDLPLLQDVEVRAGRSFLDVGMPEVAGDEPPALDVLAAAAAIVVAVDDGDRPIGYARLEVVDGHLHLEQLSVVPEHGRRGVGAALLEACAAAARARGDAELTLTTFADVPFNRPWYERHGFAVLPPEDLPTGLAAVRAVEAAHGLDPATRVVMRRPL